MKRKIHPQIRTLVFGAAWAAVCFLAMLLLRAIQWGAEPGSGFLSHLKYGISYALSGNLRLTAWLVVLSLAAGVGMVYGIRENRGIFWPGAVLAVFFSLNTLIALSPTGELQSLFAIPGAGLGENLLFWAAQLGSWYALTLIFCRWMDRPVEKGKNLCKSSRRQLLWAGLILLCWLPILILRGPGSIYRDTDMQILQFQGKVPFEASNPLVLSFVYGPLFSLGQALGGDNWGILMCVLFQTALALFACSFACEEITVQRGSIRLGLGMCLFFALAPNYASFASAVLKDSIHAPLYLLFFLYFRRAACGSRKKDWIILGILAVLVSATRKGAVYLAAFSLLGLIPERPDGKRGLTLGACALLAGHFLLTGALYPVMGVEKPMEKENYSFFYPITGYYCARHDGELTQAEKETIGAVLDYDTVRTGFSTRGVDKIKSTYHAQSKDAVQKYLALHGSFFLRHPVTCLEAIVYSRNYYFTPWSVKGERITVSMSAFDEVKPGEESQFSYWLQEDIRRSVEDRLWDLTDVSPIRELSSPGTYTWLCLLLLAAAVFGKDRKRKVLLLPLLLLTAGLLLTHLNGAARYASPLLYCIPPAMVLCRREKK